MPDVQVVFLSSEWAGYRLIFDATLFCQGKKATIDFVERGAMSHARVYVNGQEAGYWPMGTIPFIWM